MRSNGLNTSCADLTWIHDEEIKASRFFRLAFVFKNGLLLDVWVSSGASRDPDLWPHCS
jgi:hypothetical protein